jgi:hypothetical protein
MGEYTQIILLLLPLVFVELGMRIYTIFDILKEERRVLGNKKIIWVLVSGLITFGWIIYFAIGRED